MDKNKLKLFLFSATLLAFTISPAQSHDTEEMSSDEVTEMVLEIINGVVESGEKSLTTAIATIKNGSEKNSLPDLIEETSPAVVRIAIRGTMKSQQNPFFDDPFFEKFFGQPQMPREREFGGGGSGVIVDGVLGYIITNAHVINRADEIKVFTKDGREYDAEVLGSDKGTDLALIKITSNEPLPEIELGDSDSVRVGDSVVAIGAPFGLSQTVTSGIISALGRPQMTADGFGEMIQTDAAINPGNSGGALINLQGELIGIPSSIFTRSGGNIGIGFAIPVSTVKNITSQIIDFGSVKRGLLGVIISDLSEDVSEQLGLDIDKGALIQEVSPDSAAEDAGLEPGDVIVKVDGKEIESVNDLRNAIGLKRSGERCRITIVRNNRQITKNAKLGEIVAEKTIQADEINTLLAGAELSDYVEDSETYLSKSQGIIILSVEPNSNADRARLKAGDIIWAVGNMEVENLEEFKSVTEGKDILILRVKRNGRQLIIQMRK
ncbi:MAG TPA: Do family serine endopeptidase [Gammaproteobacteria bacterium]|jgi:Do/DeqQ family serine protease|nr:serine endoprotease DegQ [Gammaproteobacteria bacterium]MBQ08948.1 serine endoprotease DegQ [Gammaproteobacteria bacterium]HJL80269.1 Do family serine endopeptidase [Gammaproteobacteria bacterium]HJM08891.1 Do family serine endopeptidase [Gammaproteobacteria bacterium]HJN01169.1 Do family serine endopeptidase [Gammaproteobacteria bacterium]|tara:strand:- start:3588 stop:5066 length:1479 start_codon:yes stop_codon:yes gene_type:complete